MVSYEKAWVKLTYNQLKKLESTAKNKAETTLRITKKNSQYFQYEELPHELYLTTRQKTKIRNAFANNISTDINLSKAQLSTSGGFLSAFLGKFAFPLMRVAICMV